MSWNIKTPGDYINGPLTVAGSATITGDLTARNWFVTGGSLPGVGNSNPFAYRIGGGGLGIGAATETGTTAPIVFYAGQGGVEQYRIAPLGVNTWSDGAGGTRMTLNATGLAIGDTAFAGTRLTLRESASQPNALAMTNRNATQTWRIGVDVSAVDDKILGFYDSTSTTFRMQLTDTGNLGIGVTPSAWGTGIKGLDIGSWAAVAQIGGSSFLGFNAYASTTSQFNYKNAGAIACGYQQGTSGHQWLIAPSNTGVAGANAAFTPAMTLDTLGNLLLGTASSPTGTKVGSIAKLGGVSVEGTNYINVSTTQVAIARSIGTGGLFFVAGYNTTGGAQGWWLVASTGASVATVIASGNNTTLTVAFTQVSGVLYMNTTSGTVSVTALSITN